MPADGPPTRGSGALRQLVVWCPDWPVVAADGMHGSDGAVVGPDVPVAVVRDHQVVAVSRAAVGEGVLAGVRRHQAQARCPGLVLVEHDPARDARAFEPVVRALADLVAVVEVAEPGTIVFATRGPSRWCGGDAALAERVHERVIAALGARQALTAGIGVGVADGRFAAAVAARRSLRAGRPVLVDPGPAATATALAGVSVRALQQLAEVSAAFVDLLGRLGIHRLADLASLPAADVLARFGTEGAFAHRLAGGGDDRPPHSVVPPPELAVTSTFDDPVPLLGPLVFSARQLAEELHRRLAARGETCTCLLVEAETEHGERSERRWQRAEGMSVAAMVERVRWQLDGWVGKGLTGGVVLVRLTPQAARADQGRQLGFWGETSQADEWAARAITRLTGMLGPEGVMLAEWGGGRHPAERYRWVPAAGADLDDPAARRAALAVPDHPWPGWAGAPSPAWVAPSPVPVDVLDAGGASVQVSGRGVLSASPATVRLADGRTPLPVTAWAGPWPAEERWWDPARRRRRARFQLVVRRGDTDTALAVCLEEGRWWLEGRYE